MRCGTRAEAVAIRANERCIQPSNPERVQHRHRSASSRLEGAVALCALTIATFITSPRGHVLAQEQQHAGTDMDALPGVHEVPLAVRTPAGIRARLGFGYGWTESVLDMNDSHHRLQLDAAGSITPLPWLSTALRVLGRYDLHSGSTSDYGVVTETHLGARATFALGADFQAGAQLSLWLPAGDKVEDGFAALSGDLLLALTYAPELSPITLGLVLGVRADRSQYTGGDLGMYSPADRLALGVSDSIWAAREGLAFSYRMGHFEWIAEWAWTMYFERITESPMWIRAGARYRPTPHFQLELLLGVSPSGRPTFTDDEPLAVVQPRLAGVLSATFAWPWQTEQPRAAAPPPAPAARPAAKPPAQLRGQVLTPSGEPLPEAALTLSGGDAQHATTTDAQGVFTFAALPAGQYTLRVVAKGFIADQQSLDLHDGDASELRITLKRELPQGQIRGTVRRFNGKAVVASIAIAELGITQQSLDDGTFEINVPPGEYTVEVKARGFRPQTRKAQVDLNGVAILIVELEVAK